MRAFVGVTVVISLMFVEARTRGVDPSMPGNGTTLPPINCMFRILLRKFYDSFPNGPIKATIQVDPHMMNRIVGKTYRFYKVIDDKHLAMEEMARRFTRFIWVSHTSCAPVRFHQVISTLASQSLQRNQYIRDKIVEKLMPLGFGYEMEFATEVLREIDSMILVPYRNISDALFKDLAKAIGMVLQKTEMIIAGTQWRTEATRMFNDVGKAFPSVKRCISLDEVIQVHRQFIALITKIVNGDLQIYLNKIKEITKRELRSITTVDPTPAVDDIANILEQHIKDFIKHVAEYEKAVAARDLIKIRTLLAMILPSREAMYVEQVIKLLQNPIPGTGNNCSTPTVVPIRRGKRPRPTGLPVSRGPHPTGEPKAPETTRSIMNRVLEQLKRHQRKVMLERTYNSNEQMDQEEENEFSINFDSKSILGRPTGIPRHTGIPPRPTGGPPLPETMDDGREALKEFIWNLTTVFPSGPMSDTVNLAEDEIVQKIKTAFQQYPELTAEEILNKLYLDLGISILTQKSKCPASKFAHVMIYLLRMGMEEDLGEEDDTLKSQLANILSNTTLTNPTPREYAEYMVKGLHHATFRQLIFETARSLTKDTHRALKFLGRILRRRISKPFNEAKTTKIVKAIVHKFPRVGRCVTAQELVDWHKNQRTEFYQIKERMNITGVMEFLRYVLTSSLKNITGNDYPTQVQSMLDILQLYIQDVMDLAENFYDHVIAQDMDKMLGLFDLDNAKKTYFEEILVKLGFASTGPATTPAGNGRNGVYRSLNPEWNPFSRYRKLFV